MTANITDVQKAISDATKTVDDTIARVNKTVDDLKKQVADLQAQFSAQGATQQMVDDLAALNGRLAALDPADATTLGGTGPGGTTPPATPSTPAGSGIPLPPSGQGATPVSVGPGAAMTATVTGKRG